MSRYNFQSLVILVVDVSNQPSTTFLSHIEGLFPEKEAIQLEYYHLDELDPFLVPLPIIDDTTRENATKFDRIDVVIIGSDESSISRMPWDISFHKVIDLVHMIHLTKKPAFMIGFGAMLGLYATCTGGTILHMVNNDSSNITNISLIPEYYEVLDKNQRGGFVDRRTGDVYAFDPTSSSWSPILNIGIYHRGERGFNIATKMSSTENEPTSRFLFHRSICGHDVGTIRRTALALPLVQELSEHDSRSFLFTSCPLAVDWLVNPEIHLPQVVVVADGNHGPALLSYQNTIFFVGKLTRDRGNRVGFKLIQNFLKNVFNGVRGQSLVAHVFDGHNDINAPRVWNPPISSISVKSSLVDDPKMVARKGCPRSSRRTGDPDTRGPLHSSLGRPIRRYYNNPLLCHTQRMIDFFLRHGQPRQARRFIDDCPVLPTTLLAESVAVPAHEAPSQVEIQPAEPPLPSTPPHHRSRVKVGRGIIWDQGASSVAQTSCVIHSAMRGKALRPNRPPPSRPTKSPRSFINKIVEAAPDEVPVQIVDEEIDGIIASMKLRYNLYLDKLESSTPRSLELSAMTTTFNTPRIVPPPFFPSGS